MTTSVESESAPSALAGFTLLVSNLAISYEAAAPLRNALFINVGQSAFVTTLLAVAYFVFDVIYPNRIEIESRRLQDRVDPPRPEQRRGSLEEFRKLQPDRSLAHGCRAAISGEGRRVIRATNAAPQYETLGWQKFLSGGSAFVGYLSHRLRELITLRNSIIHGAEPAVSQSIVNASARVCPADLQAALAPPSSDTP